jgi:1,4-alpha-glucan branching enzyme
MLEKNYLKEKAVCKVTFVLPEDIQAESAHLVGDFNNWNPVDTAMKKQNDGHFSVTLDLDKGHEYQFRYLVNNSEWHNEWAADKYVSNPFNGDNSVVMIP